MAHGSLPRDPHFDEVLEAAERLSMAPPTPPPLPRQHLAPISDPPSYSDLGAVGATLRVIAIVELVVGLFALLGGLASQSQSLSVFGLSALFGGLLVYAIGAIIKLLIDIAQNSFRQTAILMRQSDGRW